jgi:hypothetical protein
MLYPRSQAGRDGAVEVTVTVLADYANLSQDGKLNIMSIFQEINPPVLPFALPQMYLKHYRLPSVTTNVTRERSQ